MIKNGFIENKIDLEYHKDKVYKIPFYHKSNSFVNITSSQNIELINTRFNPSNKKQYVAFKILNTNIPSFLLYNNNDFKNRYNAFPILTECLMSFR